MTNIEDFVEKFDLVIDKHRSLEESVVLRSSISSEEEVLQFIKAFSLKTNTNWIVSYECHKPRRIIFHKSWVCHRSDHGKVSGKSLRNAKCKAKIDILVKKVNKNTSKNDGFLQNKPPLPCVIRMNIVHSHELKEADSLQLLRVSDEVKDRFLKYFDSGLSVSQARNFNEVQLKSKSYGQDVVKSAKFNPTRRQVKYLYDYWQKGGKPMSCVSNRTDDLTTVTLKELLNGIPKKEVLPSPLVLSPEKQLGCQPAEETKKEHFAPESLLSSQDQLVSQQTVMVVPGSAAKQDLPGHESVLPSQNQLILQPSTGVISNSGTKLPEWNFSSNANTSNILPAPFVIYSAVPQMFFVQTLPSPVMIQTPAPVEQPKSELTLTPEAPLDVPIKIEPPDIDEKETESSSHLEPEDLKDPIMPLIVKVSSCDPSLPAGEQSYDFDVKSEPSYDFEVKPEYCDELDDIQDRANSSQEASSSLQYVKDSSVPQSHILQGISNEVNQPTITSEGLNSSEISNFCDISMQLGKKLRPLRKKPENTSRLPLFPITVGDTSQIYQSTTIVENNLNGVNSSMNGRLVKKPRLLMKKAEDTSCTALSHVTQTTINKTSQTTIKGSRNYAKSNISSNVKVPLAKKQRILMEMPKASGNVTQLHPIQKTTSKSLQSTVMREDGNCTKSNDSSNINEQLVNKPKLLMKKQQKQSDSVPQAYVTPEITNNSHQQTIIKEYENCAKINSSDNIKEELAIKPRLLMKKTEVTVIKENSNSAKISKSGNIKVKLAKKPKLPMKKPEDSSSVPQPYFSQETTNNSYELTVVKESANCAESNDSGDNKAELVKKPWKLIKVIITKEELNSAKINNSINIKKQLTWKPRLQLKKPEDSNSVPESHVTQETTNNSYQTVFKAYVNSAENNGSGNVTGELAKKTKLPKKKPDLFEVTVIEEDSNSAKINNSSYTKGQLARKPRFIMKKPDNDSNSGPQSHVTQETTINSYQQAVINESQNCSESNDSDNIKEELTKKPMLLMKTPEVTEATVFKEDSNNVKINNSSNIKKQLTWKPRLLLKKLEDSNSVPELHVTQETTNNSCQETVFKEYENSAESNDCGHIKGELAKNSKFPKEKHEEVIKVTVIEEDSNSAQANNSNNIKGLLARKPRLLMKKSEDSSSILLSHANQETANEVYQSSIVRRERNCAKSNDSCNIKMELEKKPRLLRKKPEDCSSSQETRSDGYQPAIREDSNRAKRYNSSNGKGPKAKKPRFSMKKPEGSSSALQSRFKQKSTNKSYQSTIIKEEANCNQSKHSSNIKVQLKNNPRVLVKKPKNSHCVLQSCVTQGTTSKAHQPTVIENKSNRARSQKFLKIKGRLARKLRLILRKPEDFSRQSYVVKKLINKASQRALIKKDSKRLENNNTHEIKRQQVKKCRFDMIKPENSENVPKSPVNHEYTNTAYQLTIIEENNNCAKVNDSSNTRGQVAMKTRLAKTAEDSSSVSQSCVIQEIANEAYRLVAMKEDSKSEQIINSCNIKRQLEKNSILDMIKPEDSDIIPQSPVTEESANKGVQPAVIRENTTNSKSYNSLHVKKRMSNRPRLMKKPDYFISTPQSHIEKASNDIYESQLTLENLNTSRSNCSCKHKRQQGKEFSVLTKKPESPKDEDYEFLMSILPVLKTLPNDHKNTLKKEIQNLVLKTHLVASKKVLQKGGTNIYRDCRVFPSSRDWKF